MAARRTEGALSQCAAETAALHGAGALPTRRGRAPYTGGTLSLHGGFCFPTRENGISDTKGTWRLALSGVDAGLVGSTGEA